MQTLNTLVKRCLTYGVVISPYQLNDVLRSYERFTIPDKKLNIMSRKGLESYIKGLYLSAQEMAGDWTRGHELLKELGFEEMSTKVGHRTYISLVYKVVFHAES